MQLPHDGDEQPRSQDTDNAGDAIHRLRSPPPQPQCTVSSEHIVDAEHCNHRQERSEIEQNQAQRSGGNYNQIRVDEEHARTGMQATLLGTTYGDKAKG